MRLHRLARLCVALLAALAVAPLGPAPAQQPAALVAAAVVPLAPDVASYAIRATLGDDGASLDGSEVIRYRNPSLDTLDEVYLHLYLNAFRSSDTLWMREAGPGHRGFAFDESAAGWIRVASISAGSQPLALEIDASETIGRVALPRPLEPGEELTLSIDWAARLPRVFARTGWAPGGFTMVAQWYPKLAVYDPRRDGWDREPWHANAEFFHDFGSYDLALTVPARRDTVVATGSPDGPPRDNGDGTATWRFRARSVSDVAWMAAEGFAVQSRPVGDVTLVVALPAGHTAEGPHYLDTAEDALRRFGEWLGQYPWERLTVVVPPDNAQGAGGMEYPMLVTSLAPQGLPGIREVDIATVHEIAHQWFPMQVASDEARDPWLDEAFADYLTQRLMAERHGAERSAVDLGPARVGYLSSLRLGLALAAEQPITKPAWEYSPLEYGATVYGKGALFLTTLERVFGRDRFTAALRAYVAGWRWQHPLAADFVAAVAAELGATPGVPEGVAPWFEQLAFEGRVLDVRVAAVEPTSALIERTGDAALSVDGILELASGRQVPWHLPPDATRLELEPAGGERITAAIADPAGKLVISPNRIDDGLTTGVQAAPLAGIMARWTELIALFLQALGQFG